MTESTVSWATTPGSTQPAQVRDILYRPGFDAAGRRCVLPSVCLVTKLSAFLEHSNHLFLVEGERIATYSKRPKVDFGLQLTLIAMSLYRPFAQRLPKNYHNARAKAILDSLLDVTGKVEIEHSQVIVTLDKRAHNPYAVAGRQRARVPSRLMEPIPWPVATSL